MPPDVVRATPGIGERAVECHCRRGAGDGRAAVCPFSLVVEAPVSCGRVAGREELDSSERGGRPPLTSCKTTLDYPPTNMYLLFWPWAKMLRTSLQSICLTRKKKGETFLF